MSIEADAWEDHIDGQVGGNHYEKMDISQVGGNHYERMKIEPIEYILANKLDFCEGNVIKYVSRYKHKNGIQDLKKAKHYLELLIKNYENRTKI